MTDCIYCKKTLDIVPNDGLHHDKCYAIILERNHAGMCYKCGANPFKHGDGWLCKDCINWDGSFKGCPAHNGSETRFFNLDRFFTDSVTPLYVLQPNIT